MHVGCCYGAPTLWMKLSFNKNCRKVHGKDIHVYHSIHLTVYLVIVAVPGRNRTLFHCVFRPHYRTGVQNFHYGRGSYVLRRRIRYSCTFTACMSSALNISSALQRIERGNAVEIHNGIMFDFYLGLPQLFYGTWMKALVMLVRLWGHTQ